MTTMRSRSITIIVAALLASAGQARAAPLETVLHQFTGFPSDGATPLAGLISDKAGNLYGTTQSGGPSNGGTVFELKPPAAGQTAWTETVLHGFNGSEGFSPSTGLVMDGAGNLYGSLQLGGPSNLGAVFKLAPPAAGQTAWTETLVYGFAGADGATPLAGLISDQAGNLYGTTGFGGTGWTSGEFSGFGTVFKLMPPAAGQTAWTEAVLHHFNGADGADPQSGLAFDAAGNLYGTTARGGAGWTGGESGNGTVFKLTPLAAKRTTWKLSFVLRFNARNGELPLAGVVLDAAGNLYGTATFGGNGDGLVFRMTPPATGQTTWTESVLHRFSGGADGGGPTAALIRDAAGNLYGTTNIGGSASCPSPGCGVVFKLTPPAAGRFVWRDTVLYSFTGSGGDGANPKGSVLLDAAGNLYGTTSAGGTGGAGTVFKLKP